MRRMFATRRPLAAPVPPPPPPPPQPTSSILSNTAIPVLTGAALVGQTLFCSTGTWAGSPASFAFQWFNDDGPIDGVGDTYTVQDAQVGKRIRCEVTAINAFGVSAPVSSVATSAIADVNLASAITAFSRTSPSGTVPMTWSLSFGSNVYEGYYLHARVYSDSALTTLVQDVVHYLTNADLQPGATIDLASDGLTAPTATQWLQLAVETTSPNGIYHGFTYGTAISPSDAVVAMAWNPLDKDAGATVSGTGNLNAAWGGGGSNYAGARTNRGLTGNGKWYWEYLVTGASARTRCAVADSSAPIGATWTPASQDVGFGAEPHAAAYPKEGTLEFNGAFTAYSAFADNAVIGFCLKISGTTKTLWVSANGTWQNGNPSTETGGLSLTTMNTPIYPACQFSFGGSLTGRFTSASWTQTAPTGAVAP